MLHSAQGADRLAQLMSIIETLERESRDVWYLSVETYVTFRSLKR